MGQDSEFHSIRKEVAFKRTWIVFFWASFELFCPQLANEKSPSVSFSGSLFWWVDLPKEKGTLRARPEAGGLPRQRIGLGFLERVFLKSLGQYFDGKGN